MRNTVTQPEPRQPQTLDTLFGVTKRRVIPDFPDMDDDELERPHVTIRTPGRAASGHTPPQHTSFVTPPVTEQGARGQAVRELFQTPATDAQAQRVRANRPVDSRPPVLSPLAPPSVAALRAGQALTHEHEDIEGSFSEHSRDSLPPPHVETMQTKGGGVAIGTALVKFFVCVVCIDLVLSVVQRETGRTLVGGFEVDFVPLAAADINRHIPFAREHQQHRQPQQSYRGQPQQQQYRGQQQQQPQQRYRGQQQQQRQQRHPRCA